MTKDTALKLIAEYADVFEYNGEDDRVITEIASRFPEDGSESKSMRWLGFMQGIIYSRGLCTLDEIKGHSMKQVVDPEDFRFEKRRTAIEVYNDRLAEMRGEDGDS